MTKEGTIVDEVVYITTVNSEDDDGNSCKEDKIALRTHFPGFEKECAYLKYNGG